MKKWMALLLCCLLCLCAVGAMAEEAVTLNLNEGYVYNIYPDRYQKGRRSYGGTFSLEEEVEYQGPYIITGTSKGLNTCLDFYSIPRNASLGTKPVTYTVTFDGVTIEAGAWATAIRFGNEESNGADITLNLINIGQSKIQPYYNQAVFSNQFKGGNTVTVNIHNTLNSALNLVGGREGAVGDQIEWGVAGNKVTVNIGDQIIASDNNMKSLQIDDSQCFLGDAHPAKPATCNDEGNVEYWQCATCQTYAISVNGEKKSVLPEKVFLSKLPHQLTLVPVKAPTCTENGNKEYYRCDNEGCGKLFSDAQGENPITGDVVIGKLGHKLSLVPAKSATCTEDGYEAHYACANCPELFADENATMSLPQPKAIPATGHDFGEDWESDAAKHWHACQCGERSGEAEHSFVTVVDRKPGETEPGEQHEECTVCGYRKAAVSIPAVGRIDLPQTGDSSSLLRWTALLGACCAGLWCLNRRRG